MGQHRATQRYERVAPEYVLRLVERMNELAAAHPRFGSRRIWALLRSEGVAGQPQTGSSGSGGWKGIGCRRAAAEHTGTKTARTGLRVEYQNGATQRDETRA